MHLAYENSSSRSKIDSNSSKSNSSILQSDENSSICNDENKESCFTTVFKNGLTLSYSPKPVTYSSNLKEIFYILILRKKKLK